MVATGIEISSICILRKKYIYFNFYIEVVQARSFFLLRLFRNRGHRWNRVHRSFCRWLIGSSGRRGVTSKQLRAVAVRRPTGGLLGVDLCFQIGDLLGGDLLGGGGLLGGGFLGGDLCFQIGDLLGGGGLLGGFPIGCFPIGSFPNGGLPNGGLLGFPFGFYYM
jgi:hypothetical protein